MNPIDWRKYAAEFSPWHLVLPIFSLLISIAFWIDFVNVAGITTKESAKQVVTTIKSWKESYHSEGDHCDLEIDCTDGNRYEIRFMLYEKRAEEIKSALTAGAEATIYTGLYINQIMEISVNGHVIIPFDAGYRALYNGGIGYASIAVMLEVIGIWLISVEIRKDKDASRHKASR